MDLELRLLKLGLDRLHLALRRVKVKGGRDEEGGEALERRLQVLGLDVEVEGRRLPRRLAVVLAAVVGEEGRPLILARELFVAEEEHVLHEVRAALQLLRVGERADAETERHRRLLRRRTFGVAFVQSVKISRSFVSVPRYCSCGHGSSKERGFCL